MNSAKKEFASRRRWAVRPLDADTALHLARDLEIPELLARLLALRGLSEPDAARTFLVAPLDSLHDPFGMKGMEAAVVHLAAEIARRAPIGIYGDYDVDGMSATALLVNFFRALEVPVHYHIPHRLREGYGLHLPGLMELKAAGCATVVTVDCGIAAVEVAEAARAAGISLIVTDHHRPAERLPDAVAVLNPRQPGCGYPFKDLSGVGIAFKLAVAVRRRLYEANGAENLPNLRQHLDLVALGTVADVMPLLGENHVLVRTGLEVLSPPKETGSAGAPGGQKAGVRALQLTADLKADSLTPGHVSFVLAPRLNAAGRVGEPRLGVELLTAVDAAGARAGAERIEEWNRQRQELQQEAVEEAEALLAAGPPPAELGAIVLGSHRWHPGVIGIVASRLVDAHFRPAALVHFEGEMGRGSVRGVPGFHVYDALKECADLLVQFGGHKEAAGLSIQVDQFEAFRARFSEVARGMLGGEPAVPDLELDAVVHFSELDVALLRRVEEMAPFGPGNPRPLFAVGGVEVEGTPQLVGQKGAHLKFRLRQRREVLDAIAFGMGELLDSPDALKGKLDVAFHPGLNRWRGAETVQLEVKALRPAGF
ncbi:MAG: single-stranded-DNA-specific exonuclease RecJ [bacterium]|nr:single-stranded-DNA-specific exonuclease RecJ [bacterium]